MTKRRFIDCDIYESQWFMDMDRDAKDLWQYICARCDNAGVWELNPKLVALHLGFMPDFIACVKAYGKRVRMLSGGRKWFITTFISFQYPRGLSDKSSPQKQIISLLKHHGLTEADISQEPHNGSHIVSEHSGGYLASLEATGLDKDYNRIRTTDAIIPIADVCAGDPGTPLPPGEPVPLGPSDIFKRVTRAGAKVYGVKNVDPWVGLVNRIGGIDIVCRALEAMAPEERDDANKVEIWIKRARKASADTARALQNRQEAAQTADRERKDREERKARDHASREPLERILAVVDDPTTPEPLRKKFTASSLCMLHLASMRAGKFSDTTLRNILHAVPELGEIASPTARATA